MENTKPERAPQKGDKYIVRLPDGMRDRIAEAAKENNRSMNAEIVARLERSFNVVVEFQAPESAAARAVQIFEGELKKGVKQAIDKLLMSSISITSPDSDHVQRDPAEGHNVRRTPIDFPEAIEKAPPPPGKSKKK
jgi:hypothetical protein